MKVIHRQKFKEYGSNYHFAHYKSPRNYTKKNIKAAYHNHISDAEEKILENPQQIWNYIHGLQQESSIPGIMTDHKDIVDIFAQYVNNIYEIHDQDNDYFLSTRTHQRF